MTRLRRAAYFAAALLVTILAPATGQATTVDELDLDNFKGQVVVIDFWASWCVPCRRSFPWLNEMQSRYADDGLVIIGINVDRNSADAHKFLQQFPADFEIVYDSEADLAKRFGVEAMPSSFIIGRDGAIRNRHLGFKTKKKDEYEAALAAALEETAQ